MSLPRFLQVVGGLCALSFPLAGNRASAQQVTIQQPIIETFSAGTTVSVPDRGRAVLGGVSRSASSRSTYGPLRTNSNYGRSTEAGGIAVHAWIHDFEELDRQALNARGADDRDPFPLDSNAAHAYRTLGSQHRSREATSGTVPPHKATAIKSRSSEPRTETTGTLQPGTLSADELYRRGVKADAAGKREVALAFWRAARDRGSNSAREELERREASRSTASRTESAFTEPARP